MKQYILLTLALLISVGTFQMVVTKSDLCPCSMLANQNDCGNMPGCSWLNNTCIQGVCSALYTNQPSCLQASQYCQWSVNKTSGEGACSTFTGCSSIQATTAQGCMQTNAQCISFNGTQCVEKNLITSQCGDYNSTICQNNVGSDGLCTLSSGSCVPITSCNQIAPDSCEKQNKIKGQICQLVGNACTQISSCSQLNQTTCTYYFSNFQTLSINLCQYNSTNCVPASDPQQLGSANCLISTGYTHRWLPSFSNPNVGICASCQQINIPQIYSLSQQSCQCSQFIYQNDCQSNSLCQWNNGVCSQNPCSNATITQQACIQTPQCYWSYSKLNPGCQTLTSCSNLQYGTNGAFCAAQSIYCAGFSNNQCQTLSLMSNCTQATQQNQCLNYIGSNGLCLWLNNACVPLTQCEQINDSVYCSNWQNYCSWNALTQTCNIKQCSDNKQSKQCTYVFTSFKGSQQQLCKWSNNKCSNSYSAAFLNATTCVAQTDYFYRWTSINAYTGFCATCAASQQTIETSLSCQCSQFQDSDSCNSSGYCIYTSGSCIGQQCTSILDPAICATKKSCYWNSSLLAGGCQQFTSCSSLQANNQLECVKMNAQCKGINNGYCQQSPSENCASIYSNSQNKNCQNYIGTDGVCFLQGTTTQTCQGFNTCSQATQQSTCSLGKFSCMWIPSDSTPSTGTCSPLSCAQFTNSQACTFYFPSLLSTQAIPCMWNTKTSTCVVASDVMTQLTESTCSANTFNSFRWISVTNASTKTTTGYCIRCQQQIYMPNQCACRQLATQQDCQSANECTWVNGACAQLSCSQIYLQNVCASTYNCSWTNGQCQQFNGNCSTLKGTGSTSCMAQNVQCVGVTANGICSNVLSTCESNTSLQTCIDQKGSDGICYWYVSKCQAAVSCNDLPETACKLRQKACYWTSNDTTGLCQPITCDQQYISYGECTFVTELLSNNRVQSCYLNGTTCTNIVETENLSSTTCLSNTNGQSRWIPYSNTNNSGSCLSCSKTMAVNQNLQICQCSQYMTYQDCFDSTLNCLWQTTTNGGYCTQQTCTSITSPTVCAATFGCAYTAPVVTSGTVTTPGSCGAFTSCSSVTFTNAKYPQLACLQYSARCQGYNGTNCTISPAAACSSYTPKTTTGTNNECDYSIGTDGPCYYDSTACIGLQSCSSIKDQRMCNFYQNLCVYVPASGSTTGSCTTVTCATFTTPATCTYYVTSFTKGDIQQCQWTGSQCQNLSTVTSLTEATCATNTAFTYRWAVQTTSAGQTQGYCTKCSINQLYQPGQCSCNQIFTKAECEINQLCSWTASTPGSCYNKPCSLINSQYLCSTNPRCSWSKALGQCQPFSSCSDLSGATSFECASYSVLCGGTPTPSHITANIQICSPTTSSTCTNNSNTTISACENTIVSKGICMMITTTSSDSKTTTMACTQVTSCSQITSQQKCEQFVHSCSWGIPSDATTTTPTCNPATCPNLNKSDCTYVLGALNSPTSSAIQCEWQAANGCVPVAGNAPLTQANCYANSFMMSRWATSLNACVSCSQNQKTLAITSSSCKCSSLDQTDCNNAAPTCTWTASGSSGTCSEQTCTNIKNQYQCSLVSKCIWAGTTTSGTTTYSCTTYSSNCNSILNAQNPLDCVQSSINCPVYNPPAAGSTTGTCTTTKSCSSQTTQIACTNYNGYLAMPQCSWVAASSKCVTITNCGLIQDVAECGLQTNRCQWSAVLNSCITQTCSSYNSQKTCNYIFTSFVPGEISLCQWNASTQDCRSAPLETVVGSFIASNSSECFVNTAHTYYWGGSDCVPCFEKILAILSIVVLLIAL